MRTLFAEPRDCGKAMLKVRCGATMANDAKPRLLTVSAALLIPTVALVLFNLLNFIIENANRPNRPPIRGHVRRLDFLRLRVGWAFDRQPKQKAGAGHLYRVSVSVPDVDNLGSGGPILFSRAALISDITCQPDIADRRRENDMEKLKEKDITVRLGHFEMQVKGSTAISFFIIAVLMVLMCVWVVQIPKYHDKSFDILSIFSLLATLLAAIVGYSFEPAKPHR
jgi:hypothetical protein